MALNASKENCAWMAPALMPRNVGQTNIERGILAKNVERSAVKKKFAAAQTAVAWKGNIVTMENVNHCATGKAVLLVT